MFSVINPIQNENEYAAALKRAEELKQQHWQPGTAEWDELELLLELIAVYEEPGHIVFRPEEGQVYVNKILLDFGVPVVS